jgi:tRNA (mo5U34)-methyltransferase
MGSPTADQTQTPADIQSAIDSVSLWYHTVEVAPGVATPGWFDLRPIVEKLPWPDVEGKRCLDVGTYDGYLAFELERRGAAEVVATDIRDHENWDWPQPLRAQGTDYLRSIAGPDKGKGFEVAKELRGSSVRREWISVYDLSPETIGEYDVVVMGSLLLHLRNPIGALEAIRSVTKGQFMSADQVTLAASVIMRRGPYMRFDGVSDLLQWSVPNVFAHYRMLESAGFIPERASGLYAVPSGAAHTPPKHPLSAKARNFATRLFAGNPGVPHHAILARPASSAA